MKDKECKKICLTGSIIAIAGVAIMLFWLIQTKLTKDEWVVVNILSIGIPLVLVNMGMMCWLSGKVESVLKRSKD